MGPFGKFHFLSAVAAAAAAAVAIASPEGGQADQNGGLTHVEGQLKKMQQDQKQVAGSHSAPKK